MRSERRNVESILVGVGGRSWPPMHKHFFNVRDATSETLPMPRHKVSLPAPAAAPEGIPRRASYSLRQGAVVSRISGLIVSRKRAFLSAQFQPIFCL